MARHAAKAKRPARKETRKPRRQQENVIEIKGGILPDKEDWSPLASLECRSQAQYQYLQMLKSKELIFGIGPAGTGKTFMAVSHAAIQLVDRHIQRIVITRPVVATEEMGFLPGEIEDKFAPYFEPIRRVLLNWISESHLENLLKRKRIEIAPLAFIRGMTFDDAFVILDEAQNTTPKQMKLFLTRIGRNCTVVVDGDLDQKDIKGKSGLEDALSRLQKLSQVGVFEFTEDDIVRSGLVKDILKSYRR